MEGDGIRPAALADVEAIFRLLGRYAEDGLLLPRSRGELYESLRDYAVAVAATGAVVGCAALHIYGPHMAEIKAVAVERTVRGQGYGRRLVEAQRAEAGRLGLERLFCLTYQPEFFARLGFSRVDRSRLPEKVWGECVRCPRFLACDEIPMWREVG